MSAVAAEKTTHRKMLDFAGVASFESAPEFTSEKCTQAPPPIRALPQLARGRTSRAAYQVLEALRAHDPQTTGSTTYEKLMSACGLRSRASIAKALRELSSLGAVRYEIRRDVGGHVSGLWVEFKGLPTKVSAATRATYQEQAARAIARTQERLNMLQADMAELRATAAE